MNSRNENEEKKCPVIRSFSWNLQNSLCFIQHNLVRLWFLLSFPFLLLFHNNNALDLMKFVIMLHLSFNFESDVSPEIF